MADTLPYGPVVPSPTDSISSTGVAEIRTLGSSVSGALGAAQLLTESVDTDSRARDTALGDQIAGMEGLDYVGTWDDETTYRINDVVTWGGDSWARLTAGSSGVPGESATDWGLVAKQGDGGGFGELNETEVVGLYDTVDTGIDARLTALEQDTGPRIMNSLVANYVSGDIVLQRTGKTVYLTISELEVTPNNGATTWSMGGFIPNGFRFYPPAYKYFSAFARTLSHNSGDIRVNRYGGLDIYNVDGLRTNVSAVWATSDAYPTVLPGDSN